VSRSVSEPESASLNQVRAARLPEGLKPEIRSEETFESNAGVLRGERGQRAGKVGLGRLGDPCRRFRRRNKTRSKTISCGLEAGESERLVVAMKRGNARGAKGPWHGGADSEDESTDWRNPITERTLSLESEAAIGNQITARCDECSRSSAPRKPDAGNPHVRFEEGEGTRRSLANAFHSVRPSLLYLKNLQTNQTEGNEVNEVSF
jgi:hypothetical protein